MAGPPRAPSPPRLFLSHSLRLSRASHGPGLCPLLCFPSLLTGLDRNAGLAASGVLSGSAPDTWTGEASRVSAAFSNDTDGHRLLGASGHTRTAEDPGPGEAALPPRWGAPGSLRASHHALLARPSTVAPKRVRR